jgi:hypothetical protein
VETCEVLHDPKSATQKYEDDDAGKHKYARVRAFRRISSEVQEEYELHAKLKKGKKYDYGHR